MPARSDLTIPNATAERIRQEIARLRREQDAALQKAAYGGMTPDETKVYDERLERLAELNRCLTLLEKQPRL